MKNKSFHTLTTFFRISIILFGLLFFGQEGTTASVNSTLTAELSQSDYALSDFQYTEAGDVLPDWDVSKEQEPEEFSSDGRITGENNIHARFYANNVFSSHVTQEHFFKTPLYDLFCCWKYHLS